MKEVVIRTASLDDAPEIAHLMSQLGYSTSAAEMKERLRGILSTASYMTFVAEIRGEVVGMVGIGISHYYEKNGVYGRLLALVIDETHRRQGIGASLVERAESWLREHKVTSIVINSSKHRSEAHCLYKRLGYEETGLRFVKSLS
jgi:ribosomal protein S18 acetylase RimI-like enzyme